MRVSSCAAVWAVALAEMRSARRQVRTWGFSLLAVGVSFLFFVGSGVQHALDSRMSPVSEFPAPRFVISIVGMPLVLVFLFGLIFLAFDVRGRDQRERMVEVLDTRPVSNVELLLGRLLGLVVTACIPALVLVFLVQTFGIVGGAVGAPTEPVQPASLATFLFVDALPMFLAWGALVILLAVLLRNRLLVAVSAFGVLGIWMLWSQSQPLYLAHLAGPTQYGDLVSDLLPRVADAATVLHRLALVVLAVGVVFAAAALHPRLDSRRSSPRFAVSAALVGVGAAAMTGLFLHAREGVEARDHWLAVHEAAVAKGGADIEHIAGTVHVAPGRLLTIDISMRLAARPRSREDRELVMSFNPGMAVESLKISGVPTPFLHEDGLLRIETPPTHGSFELDMLATGVPDPSFAYLDSAFDLGADSTGRRNATLYLGRDASIYDADYVALMPGVHWLPSPGANVGREDPGRVARDFYTVDLTVEAPPGWLVAGPGLRRAVGAGEFRFNPTSPVPAVALIASRFERRAIAVAGVELELLMSPGHLDNLTLFENAVEPLSERLEELLGEAIEAGIEYPYRGLSVVEVPATLRRCGGGWRMDTVQAQPGILLMSERGFPTARFDVAFRDGEKEVPESDGAEFRIKALERYLRNDYSGGDPFVGMARNVLRFQTGVEADGMAATALEFVVEELVDLVLNRTAGFFSAHVFLPDGSTSLGRIALGASKALGIGGGSQGIRDAVANRPAVWDLALGTSLAGLNPEHDPDRVLEALALRGGAIARSIYDALGRERTGALLRELRREHGGGSYDADAFYAAAHRVGGDLGPLLGDWLNDAGLPGFLASSARTVRLPDTARGGPRFETRVQLRNDEPVPGLLRLRYVTARWRKTKGRGTLSSEPVRVRGHSSVEVSLVTASPIAQVWMAPYLSLNRRDVQLAVEEANEPGVEGYTGSRPSDWEPPKQPGIVVDDLDAGFVVERNGRGDRFRIGDFVSEPPHLKGEMDHGIPDYLSALALNGRHDGEWRRQEVPSSWGKYRHTVARAAAADGHATAVFAAELPGGGEWRLDYHMPLVRQPQRGVRLRGQPQAMVAALGDYDMVLEFGNGERRSIMFDATRAEMGWNDLGRFDLPKGQVRLVVSNRTSGDVVLADAIRWRPVAGFASNKE
ncbi:MAG: hypothetical protein OXK76_10890 [Gammaproteobacteria bacterium]|nr:hypothetical protein [Gammaproteobacteria bacterium]